MAWGLKGKAALRLNYDGSRDNSSGFGGPFQYKPLGTISVIT